MTKIFWEMHKDRGGNWDVKAWADIPSPEKIETGPVTYYVSLYRRGEYLLAVFSLFPWPAWAVRLLCRRMVKAIRREIKRETTPPISGWEPL